MSEELKREIKKLLEMNEAGPRFWISERTVRVYTRESRDPSRNRNGGEYDFYTDLFIGEDGRVHAVDDWSAEYDARDWNVYDERVYDASGLTFDGLVEMVEQATNDIKASEINPPAPSAITTVIFAAWLIDTLLAQGL